MASRATTRRRKRARPGEGAEGDTAPCARGSGRSERGEEREAGRHGRASAVAEWGNDPFEEVRGSDKCLDVDRAAMLGELVAGAVPCFLARPPMLGKSLTLSTLKALLQAGCSRGAPSRRSARCGSASSGRSTPSSSSTSPPCLRASVPMGARRRSSTNSPRSRPNAPSLSPSRPSPMWTL
jgi:hypothetical protein